MPELLAKQIALRSVGFESSVFRHHTHCWVAQLAEHPTVNRRVVGSRPTLAATFAGSSTGRTRDSGSRCWEFDSSPASPWRASRSSRSLPLKGAPNSAKGCLWQRCGEQAQLGHDSDGYSWRFNGRKSQRDRAAANVNGRGRWFDPTRPLPVPHAGVAQSGRAAAL